jgi:hypothetical protein
LFSAAVRSLPTAFSGQRANVRSRGAAIGQRQSGRGVQKFHFYHERTHGRRDQTEDPDAPGPASGYDDCDAAAGIAVAYLGTMALARNFRSQLRDREVAGCFAHSCRGAPQLQGALRREHSAPGSTKLCPRGHVSKRAPGPLRGNVLSGEL